MRLLTIREYLTEYLGLTPEEAEARALEMERSWHDFAIAVGIQQVEPDCVVCP